MSAPIFTTLIDQIGSDLKQKNSDLVPELQLAMTLRWLRGTGLDRRLVPVVARFRRRALR